jgi:hypothetical protein
MRLSQFFRALVEHGRLRVAPPADVSGEPDRNQDQADVETAIREWDAANRSDFPGEPPPLRIDAAQWALMLFHQACQCAIYRDLGAAEIDAALALPCPAEATLGQAGAAAQHYSVDLVFRFLPDLFRLTKAASEGDPLCNHLRRWAVEWPLSSVGMAGVNPVDVSAVSEHAGLLQVYVDRIIARRDTSRLTDARVRAAVRAALGHFDDLSSPLAAALKNFDQPTDVNIAGAAVAP